MFGSGDRLKLSIGAVIAMAVLAVLVPVPHAEAAPEYKVYVADAEFFKLPSGASWFSDSTSNWGTAVVFKKRGTAARMSLMPGGSRFVVRARGRTCGGAAARMVVRVGKKTVVSATVRTGSWKNYTGKASTPAGTNKFSIAFTNGTSKCSRRLSVDTITVYSKRPDNQAKPGSRCVATDAGLPRQPPAPGWTTSGLGAGAPGYYEMAPPLGDREGKAPRGIMLLIHGGGWFISGPGAAAVMRDDGERWRERGWRVVTVTSGKSCGSWVKDVLSFYDRVADEWPNIPVCALGESAGAHLAVMLAAKRQSLDCAISEGGPMDFGTIAQQPASGGQTLGPRLVRGWAASAFGEANLAANSPSNYVDDIKARVMLAVAERDPLIPGAQATEMEEALRSAQPVTTHDSMILEGGRVRWVHGNISPEAYDAVETRENEVASPKPTDDGLKVFKMWVG